MGDGESVTSVRLNPLFRRITLDQATEAVSKEFGLAPFLLTIDFVHS